MELPELFAALNGGDAIGSDDDISTHMAPLNASARASALLESFKALEVKHAFRVGQLVQWKAGMRSRKWPAYGEPILVTEVLAEPLLFSFEKQHGSPYFREPLDMKAAHFDEEGDLLEFHYDSRRFEPYTGGIA